MVILIHAKAEKKADKMNSKFKALIKATGNNHLTDYILTSYNKPQTLFHERRATSHEPRTMNNEQ